MSEDESAIEDAKRILRRRLRTERAGRGPEWAASRAHALAANLQELTRSLEARAISAYLSTPDEPDTRAFLTWAAEEGIRVLLPIIRPDGLLDWAEHDGTETIEATLGMPEPTADALAPTGVNVTQFTDDGITKFTVRQRMTLRTTDIARAQRAVRRQFDLVRRGVLLEEGSGMAYTFTRLNDIKPEMVAAATKDARAAAEQFAKDSDTGVGGIKQATQGYFEINARDGDSGGGWGVSDTPFKKVRVVTTVDFYLR